MAGGAVEHVVFAIHPLLYEAEPPADIVAHNHRVCECSRRKTGRARV